MEEVAITQDEALNDLRQAMGIPNPDDVWEHDGQTWTVADMAERFDLRKDTVRRRAEEAVKTGTMRKGQVQITRGRYVDAYRLVDGE